MTINTWNPSTETNTSDANNIDLPFLHSIIERVHTEGIDNIEQWLSTEVQQQQHMLMQQDKESWVSISSTLANEDIIALIKFFTLAEMCYPQWEAGEKSPVIGLAKTLRKKDSGFDKDLLKWIKANTRNKYLPYGPL